MTKKKLVKITVPFLLIVAVIAAAVAYRGRNKSTESEYFTAAVVRGPLKRVINATGVVQTVVTVQVGSQISGQVQELFADFNSQVKRGQLLAKLDPRNQESAMANAQAQVSAAQARLRSAEAETKTLAANLESARANREAARVTRDNTKLNLDRAVELSERGVASKNDFDTAKANYDSAVAKFDQAQASYEQVQAQATTTEASIAQAKAGLDQAEAELSRAKVNLEYANIFSPVDGVVISRDVDVGQTIAASMSAPTLFTIATDLSEMQVKASVDEADIGSISEAATVTFTVDAYPNEIFEGRIAEIRLSPTTVQNVVTYSVILSIRNDDLKLKPGMTANIAITVAQTADALKIPNAALRYNPPGMKAEPPVMQLEEAAKPAEAVDPAAPSVSLPLAPGQRWNPDDKLRFVSSGERREHPGSLWVLGPDDKPLQRQVVLGITDGAMTELLSGDVHEGDLLIVGDASQVDTQIQPGGRGLFGGGGGRGRGN